MKENVEVYADDIDMAISEYLEERGIKSARDLTSSMWAACLKYVYVRVFKNGSLLKCRNAKTDKPYEYDLDRVLSLVDRYIFLCNDNNKRIAVQHFCILSGIDKSTISLWANDLRRSGDKRAKQIYMMLMDGSVQAADDMMISKNGVNSIAYANRIHDNYDAFMSKQESVTALDMHDLGERLGISDKLKALPDKGKPADNLIESDINKYPWMALPDDADLDLDI